MLLGDVSKTERGFEVLSFYDANQKACTLQQSSAMDNSERGGDTPGSSYVWLGVGSDRMHLHRDQVTELVYRLKNWIVGHTFDPRL